MLNKLSFIPTESLYPVQLSLDDFDDAELIGQQKETITDEKRTTDSIRFLELKKKLWNDSITKEEMKDLSKLLEKFKEKILLSSEIDLPIRNYILDLLTSVEEGYLFRKEMFWLAHIVSIGQANDSKTADEYSPDWFGTYCLENDTNYFPWIKLNKERLEHGKEILSNSSKGHLDRDVLYTVVLIYALANALMDPANKLLDEKGNLLPYTEKNRQHEVSEEDEFCKKILATTITLHYFDSLDQNQYQQVREYFTLLPFAYKVGVAEYEKLRDTKCRWMGIADKLCD